MKKQPVLKKKASLIIVIPLMIIIVPLSYLIIFGSVYLFSDVIQKDASLEKQVEKDKTVIKKVGYLLSSERLDSKNNNEQISEYWEIHGTKSRYAIIEIWYNNNSEDYKLDSLDIIETYDKFKKGIHSVYRY